MNPDLIGNVEKLLEARKAYYNTGHPIMSDQEYDALEETIRQLVPNHPLFELIGQTPSTAWKKAEHAIPMGSLRKSHIKEDFLKWAEKYKEETLVMQLKLDGLSLSLNYQDSTFIQAITRGDGFIGEEITANVKLMQGFKQTLDYKGYSGSIRAEIVLDKALFNQINSILPKDDQYSNPRNAASGISRRLDGQFCKYLRLICYDLAENQNETEKIEKIKFMGLDTPNQVVGNYEEMLGAYETFKDLRDSIPFGIDGVVIKVNSYKVQAAEGEVQNRPKAQIAWKFDPPGAATVLVKVTWENGRTGVVTPLGHVTPVEIDGSIISKVTLHNVAEIKRLGIGIGDTAMLVKAGDVIPKILSVIEHKNNPIEIPTVCPCCGGNLTNNEIQLFCESATCSAKELQRILYFIKTTKIEEFGEALAEKLYAEGKLRSISDIFILKKEDIASIEGWGEKSANTIIENINNQRVMAPEIFLAALGIPTLSTSTAEDLWAKYKDLTKVLEATVEDICTMKGYSTISATKIVEGLNECRPLIASLLNHVKFEGQIEGVSKLSGQSFCFTGAMSKSRAFFQDLVKKHGGKNLSTVTKDLTYLVCNEDKGSSKSQKADKFGVKIITEEVFLKLCEEEIKPSIKIYSPSLFEE